MDINKIIVIGNMTSDPLLNTGQYTNVTFSIANNRVRTVNGGRKEEVSFFECVAWGKLAEVICQYSGKGSKVCIEGRLRQNTWETPDGNKRSKIQIQVESLQFLSKSNSTQSIPPNYDSQQPTNRNSHGAVDYSYNGYDPTDDIF